MIDAALLSHLGPRIVHVTARGNLPAIAAQGLLSVRALAEICGSDANTLTLRRSRVVLATPFGQATLNHQNPINHGMAAADSVVDGHTAKSWAAQLDTRVYFSRADGKHAFAESIGRDVPMVTLSFDTVRMIEVLGDRMFLCPINSGNFTQGGAHARRGDWIYVPVSAGFEVFRLNRVRRGLVKTKDSVREISVLGPIPASVLTDLEMRVES